MGKYVIGIDQSTQGTKALLLDEQGRLKSQAMLLHKQKVNELGWVSHDLNEIYRNTVRCVQKVLDEADIPKADIAAIGISNQRETTAVWDRGTGEPCCDAIVWQCARAESIIKEIEKQGYGNLVKTRTGISLSPYFPAAKMAWLLGHLENGRERAEAGRICLGTIDTWLVYKLTGGCTFLTDYSNASRTQLFQLSSLNWDKEVLDIFQIPEAALPKLRDSDGYFGETDLEGYLPRPVPIHGVMGDSHAALFGQGCLSRGMIKTTYGTGSSIMMNIGPDPVIGKHGVVTSLAWKMSGETSYVLEGNINNTGAVITWLKDELGMIRSPGETADLAKAANPLDRTYLVPAFSGFGAPYWDADACGIIYGMSRTTGKAEIVKAALECTAYQIKDIIIAMEKDTGIHIKEIRADGGAAGNPYLMQFQSDILDKRVRIPQAAELSGIGAAYAAGISMGIYRKEHLFEAAAKEEYLPGMSAEERERKYNGWKNAVGHALSHSDG